MPILKNGFTLIELLVVITIISITTVLTLVNFNRFSSDQAIVRAIGQVQTALRLAQSNATSATLCGTQAGASWAVIFNLGNVGVACAPIGSPLQVQKTYRFENAKIDSITCSDNTIVSFPVTVSYASLSGSNSFSGSDYCISNTSNLTITLKNILNNSSATKTITISKGGAINVQ